ncbi:hypothetical protein GCM10010260_29640 [Streptomyces filipinensis]|uniref:Uncharacterized protein n=1 Tax=Streptomyces filipinensis TaxID=66887 RepID=A0A918MBL0_9ACTN|nr:hypothetical protein GCM10010260_29640 [Streptomyces filipinensis]
MSVKHRHSATTYRLVGVERDSWMLSRRTFVAGALAVPAAVAGPTQAAEEYLATKIDLFRLNFTGQSVRNSWWSYGYDTAGNFFDNAWSGLNHGWADLGGEFGR